MTGSILDVSHVLLPLIFIMTLSNNQHCYRHVTYEETVA